MNRNLATIVLTTYLLVIVVKTTHSWKYQTKCTKVSKNSILHNTNGDMIQADVAAAAALSDNSYSIVDDFEHVNSNANNENELANKMQLKCPNANDFLFIGLTQYGVSSRAVLNKNNETCFISENDCLVTVDYLANECNGLNSCNIQLDSQFLHTCRNLSDYLSVAYECIPGSKRVDICSNDETFIVDSSNLNSRFGNFYLTSPSYPSEYSSNLNNCSCKLEYVKIDDSASLNEKTIVKTAKMNLAFKTYEFDLEEGESVASETTSNEKCTKDILSLSAYDTSKNLIKPSQQVNLCGQYKEFKEFYLNGDLVRLNLSTDDAIARRGFLIEIQPTQETVCPSGTERFNSKKCIKYFSESKLNWLDAVDACKSNSGKLLQVNDFVDNLKLNNMLRTKSIESPMWSVYNSNEMKHSSNKCMSKQISGWQNESCNKRLDYICEFDSIKLNANSKSNENNNRLIKVSCGSLSTVYSAVSTTTIETTKTKRKQAPIMPIISWSSLIDKSSLSKQQKPKLSNEITSLFTTTSRTIVNDESENSDESYLIETDLKQEKLITESLATEIKNTTSNSSVQTSLISQELALVIAIICGFSVVFILVNIFCIWNYYNRKLKAYIEKSETNTESNYRTSTLISRNAKLGNSTTSSNNRSMSTVDSYVKMLPTYETCINVPVNNYLQATTTANSSPNSTSCLLNNTNEQKMELIKSFFQKQALVDQQQHYYETLSLNKNNNNHHHNYMLENHVPQFDSMVVVPLASASSASASSNSHVLLLNSNTSYRHLPANCVLNDLIASTSIPSPATNCQTKPLITFMNTSSSTNNNPTSDNTSSTSCSSSSSPAPAEL